MSTTTLKTTLYLQPAVKRYLQHAAVANDTTISALVNDILAGDIEDRLIEKHWAKDIEVARKEPTISFDEMMEGLGLRYDDLRD